MVKYKFTKKRNMIKPDEPEKMYAIPAIVNRVNTRELCQVVTNNTSINHNEAETTFNLVCDSIPRELKRGSSVQLGRLGWMRLSFGSEGVDSFDKFDPQSMIKNLRVIFTPSKDLMAQIKKDLSFENVGVVEGGFTFPNTKSYLEYKQTGKLPVAGGNNEDTEPEPGGETGGEDEDLFG